MSATNVAKAIKEIEAYMTGKTDKLSIKDGEINVIHGIHSGKIMPGPADNSITNPDDEQNSIAKKMSAQGVDWTKSDKSPGSRLNGAAILCELLEAALEASEKQSGIPERPALYFFENVRGIISRFPILARDEKVLDDVDTDQEDHDYDALRYRVASDPKQYADNVEVLFKI